MRKHFIAELLQSIDDELERTAAAMTDKIKSSEAYEIVNIVNKGAHEIEQIQHIRKYVTSFTIDEE